jgi:hypothetical protein
MHRGKACNSDNDSDNAVIAQMNVRLGNAGLNAWQNPEAVLQVVCKGSTRHGRTV